MCEGTLEVSSCPHQQEQVVPMPILVLLCLDSCPGRRSHGPPGKPAHRLGRHPEDYICPYCSIPFCKLCPQTPGVCLLGQPGPLIPPLIPAAAAGSCLLFIFIMVLNLVTSKMPNNWTEPSSSSSCHEEVWNLNWTSWREILKNKPQLSSLGTNRIAFTCDFKQNFMVAWKYR